MGGATRFLMLLTTPFPFLKPRPSVLRLARHSGLLSTHSLQHPFKFLPVKSSSAGKFHSQSTSIRDENFVDQSSSISGVNVSQPWPEWSSLIDRLQKSGFFEKMDKGVGYGIQHDDGFLDTGCLSPEFVMVARVCLLFAREKDNLLGLLSRRDIELVVENGSAFLFRDADELKRRMKSFLGTGESSVMGSDKASMVDLMKYLLCYVNNTPTTSGRNHQLSEQIIESSVRNLLIELSNVCFGPRDSGISGSMQDQFQDKYSQAPRPYGRNIEMKKGDWICSKCSFMNFARNVKCLECEEPRPKRQLTGGEWECPQCDFFNYGRNVVCLRCDCKRPGEISFDTANVRSGPGGNHAEKVDINSRLAANEEKAQRWFSKVSQLDNASDMNNATADEDFPEIMPLRKGVNRFVVSTRKTPLERRLANAQYRRDLGNEGIPEGNDPRTGVIEKSYDTTISRSLDDILGRNSAASGTDNKGSSSGQNAGAVSPPRVSSSVTTQRGSNSSYVPFVPLPADMFAKKPQNLKTEENEKMVGDDYESVTSKNIKPPGPVTESNGKTVESLLLSNKPTNLSENNDKEREEADKSERWFKRVAELHDVTDLASAIPDEDFPDIMPMRKGENRFVVSKKKDRSLTSPVHKRRMAMEQASNSNFVPFVPFPPGYFAKKDKQNLDGLDSSQTSESSNSVSTNKLPRESEQCSPPKSYMQTMEHQHANTGSWNSGSSEENLSVSKTNPGYRSPNSEIPIQNTVHPSNFSNNSSSSGYSSTEKYTGSVYGSQISGYPNQNSTSPQDTSSNNWRSGYSGKESAFGSTNVRTTNTSYGAPNSSNHIQNVDPTNYSYNTSSSGYSTTETHTRIDYWTPRSGNPSQNSASPQGNFNIGTETASGSTTNLRDGWTGKSLEGSAVKEPDPLDMSEEAKAERWFRRAAQIKDISELSQIPDEDFPSIMPMRKGVNRFVISKRKTPLERRLTSPQYRKNLPIFGSDPLKKENDSS